MQKHTKLSRKAQSCIETHAIIQKHNYVETHKIMQKHTKLCRNTHRYVETHTVT